MTDTIKDGGPAFPRWEFQPGPHNSGMYVLSGGMSLRDWFAGQTLAGLLAHASAECPHKSPGMAWKLADDMLAQREAKS